MLYKKAKFMSRRTTISMVKHGGAPVLLWGCFAVARGGNRDCLKDIMTSLKYQAILAKMAMDFKWTFRQIHLNLLKLGSGISRRMFLFSAISTQGMGRDCSREATDASKHLQAAFIGGSKE